MIALALACNGDDALGPSDEVGAASGWPEADALFHSDPSWLGADGASSVDLGGGRVLWLFNDTFVDTAGQGRRSQAKLIRNSLGVQQGYDPSGASIAFHWGGTATAPVSWFAESATEWAWPTAGIRIGGRVIVFLMRVEAAEGGLGFTTIGWKAVAITNPDADPASWQTVELTSQADPDRVMVGSGGLILEGGYLYAYSPKDEGSHKVYLVRWPETELDADSLPAPEWWMGPGQWARSWGRGGAPPLWREGQTELTVHYDALLQRYVGIQTSGFGAVPLALRSAPSLTGPWSGAGRVYTPPEARVPGAYTYAAKAHPELTGADLVLTYASNAFDFDQLVSDTTLYYPRFVRVGLVP